MVTATVVRMLAVAAVGMLVVVVVMLGVVKMVVVVEMVVAGRSCKFKRRYVLV